jgi:Fur family peroxide stress response transcriptional regulator
MSGDSRPASAQSIERKMEALRNRCRERALKVTPQRVAVYKALLLSREHPSAETVCRQVRKLLPNVSLDTVNRTLLTLQKIGMAFAVEGSGDAKRFDAHLQPHQHFKCLRCKRIFDLHYEPFNRIDVPRKLRDSFTVLRATVYLEGYCDRCRDRAD